MLPRIGHPVQMLSGLPKICNWIRVTSSGMSLAQCITARGLVEYGLFRNMHLWRTEFSSVATVLSNGGLSRPWVGGWALRLPNFYRRDDFWGLPCSSPKHLS